MKKHKKWSVVLGRFQCLPPHKGHIQLVKTLLKERKNILIMLRKEDGTNKNPYTQKERFEAFCKIFPKETKTGRIIIASVPDIDEVVHGRNKGWNVREIKLPEDIQKISATEIRKKTKPLDYQGININNQKGKISDV